MRLMVTNDDGITSEGLQTLVRHLARTEHDVVVIAPDSDWSGAGASLQGWDAIADVRSELVTIDGAPGVEAWAVSGSPALTVMLGRLGAFGPAPDLIVSGINAGANTGNSILHSGTVGAALTAQNFGGSGLAVSVAATSRRAGPTAIRSACFEPCGSVRRTATAWRARWAATASTPLSSSVPRRTHG